MKRATSWDSAAGWSLIHKLSAYEVKKVVYSLNRFDANNLLRSFCFWLFCLVHALGSHSSTNAVVLVLAELKQLWVTWPECTMLIAFNHTQTTQLCYPFMNFIHISIWLSHLDKWEFLTSGSQSFPLYCYIVVVQFSLRDKNVAKESSISNMYRSS